MRRYGGVTSPGLPHGDPDDCGAFCVWWYIVERRAGCRVRQHREWAYAIRDGAIWCTSSPVSGFTTREAAVVAGETATRVSP